MKFRNLKTKVFGPVLLLIPMTCMHLGDDHHSGHDHFSIYQAPDQCLTSAPAAGYTMNTSKALRPVDVMAQEEPTTRPEAEKGG